MFAASLETATPWTYLSYGPRNGLGRYQDWRTSVSGRGRVRRLNHDRPRDETLVADSADVAVICLLPSDSCLRSAGHHSVPQCILEPNLTDINGNHEHFRNRPAVRPRACRRGAWTANKFHLRRYSLR